MNELHAKIIELVPGIMKFEFGLRIRLLHDQSMFAYEMYEKFGKKIWIYDGTSKFVSGNGWMDVSEYLSHKKSWEVIGRPITLSDVLRALEKSGKSGIQGHLEDNGFHFFIFEKGTCHWNLTTDLDGQSPETITFLKKVLL